MQELRLNKVIFDIVARELQREMIADFWIVSVTRVKVSKDFSYADVYVSTMPSNPDVIKYINSRIWHFQQAVNKQLQRKVVPRLRFYYDDIWEYMTTLDNLIN